MRGHLGDGRRPKAPAHPTGRTPSPRQMTPRRGEEVEGEEGQAALPEASTRCAPNGSKSPKPKYLAQHLGPGDPGLLLTLFDTPRAFKSTSGSRHRVDVVKLGSRRKGSAYGCRNLINKQDFLPGKERTGSTESACAGLRAPAAAAGTPPGCGRREGAPGTALLRFSESP